MMCKEMVNLIILSFHVPLCNLTNGSNSVLLIGISCSLSMLTVLMSSVTSDINCNVGLEFITYDIPGEYILLMFSRGFFQVN